VHGCGSVVVVLVVCLSVCGGGGEGAKNVSLTFIAVPFNQTTNATIAGKAAAQVHCGGGKATARARVDRTRRATTRVKPSPTSGDVCVTLQLDR
jgi:hypothetical protein